MLTKKQFGILFLLSIIPFVWYSLRPDLMGYDGYLYLATVCGQNTPVAPTEPLFNVALALIPCDINTIKLILWGLCFTSLLGVAFIGQLFSVRHGWKAGIMVFLAGTFIMEFAKFENDQFAYPFIYWGAYFFLRASMFKESRKLNQIICLFLLAAGAGFWGGSMLFLIILGFISSLMFIKISGVPVLFIFTDKIVSAIRPNNHVAENISTHGLVFLFLTVLGLVNFTKSKHLAVPGIAFLILGILNPKFIFLALPFLCAGLVYFYETHPNFAIQLQTVAVILALFGGIALLYQPPFQYEHDAINYALDYNSTIVNDSRLGYMVIYHGGVTKYYGSVGLLEQWQLKENELAVTRNWLPQCEFKGRIGEMNVWNCYSTE